MSVDDQKRSDAHVEITPVDLSRHDGHTPGNWRIFEHLQFDALAVEGESGAWVSWHRAIAAGEDTIIAELDARKGVQSGFPSVESSQEMLANAQLVADAPALRREVIELRKRVAELEAVMGKLRRADAKFGHFEKEHQSTDGSPDGNYSCDGERDS